MAAVLVAYGSRYGSTAEIAGAIGDALRDRGLEVVVTPAGEAGDLSRFRAAVIGSGVYAGRWERSASRLLRREASTLEGMPVWVFSSGPVSEWPERAALPPGPGRRARRVGALDHALFGGRVPAEAGGWIARSMAKRVPVEGKDLRDWDRIRAWAYGIATELGAPERREPVAAPAG